MINLIKQKIMIKINNILKSLNLIKNILRDINRI